MENTEIWVLTGLLLVPQLILLIFVDYTAGLTLLAGLAAGVGMFVSLGAVAKLKTISRLRLTLVMDSLIDSAQNGKGFIIVFDDGNKKLTWNANKDRKK